MTPLLTAFFLASAPQTPAPQTAELKKEIIERLSDRNDDPWKDDFVYDDCDTEPSFPGGQREMERWGHFNVKFPAEAKERNRQGEVAVRFIVRPDGTRTDAEIVHSVDEALDAETLRVVQAMPRWIPATRDGRTVSVRYTFKLTFRLLPGIRVDHDDQTVPYTNPRD